jgi:hypothetical protein
MLVFSSKFGTVDKSMDSLFFVIAAGDDYGIASVRIVVRGCTTDWPVVNLGALAHWALP